MNIIFHDFTEKSSQGAGGFFFSFDFFFLRKKKSLRTNFMRMLHIKHAPYFQFYADATH